MRKSHMFKSVEELKAFLEWAKGQNIEQVKVADIEIKFSALAVIPTESLKEMTSGSANTLVDDEQMSKEEYEEILFHSSN